MTATKEIIAAGALGEIVAMGFDDRDDGFRAHVARLKVVATLNASTSVSSFVQVNSAADQVITNVVSSG